jgi:hypothetical protein
MTTEQNVTDTASDHGKGRWPHAEDASDEPSLSAAGARSYMFISRRTQGGGNADNRRVKKHFNRRKGRCINVA